MMVGASIPRLHRATGYDRLTPEGYDSDSLAGIKQAFGLYGWMDFINLANIQYRSQGGRALVSQVRYDATVGHDDDENLAIVFWMPDGDQVRVTIPENYPGLDLQAIEDLIPDLPAPVLNFTMPENAGWLAAVIF